MTNEKSDLTLEDWEEILNKKAGMVIEATQDVVQELLNEGLDVGLVMDIAVARPESIIDSNGKSRAAVGSSTYFYGHEKVVKIGLRALTELIQKEYPDS